MMPLINYDDAGYNDKLKKLTRTLNHQIIYTNEIHSCSACIEHLFAAASKKDE